MPTVPRRTPRIPTWFACLLGLLLAVCLPAHAKRVALLIGNAAYASGPLTNPANDVRVMAAALRDIGFDVQQVIDANQTQMKRAVRDFGERAQGAEIAFVYYSGHGTQAWGENYLIPIGASIAKESDYEIEAVAANALMRQIVGARPKATIVVLDACRDNPLASLTKSTGKGLARMDAPAGSMIAFATAPNTTAADEGLYARVLAAQLRSPGLELYDVFRNTAAEVRRLSNGRQEPRVSEVSITDRIYLAGVAAPPPPVRPAVVPEAVPATTTTGAPGGSTPATTPPPVQVAVAPPSVPRPPVADTAGALSGRAFKIGYVNSERVLRESEPAKAAQRRLEAEFKDREQRLRSGASPERAQFDADLKKRKDEELATVVQQANRHIRSIFEGQRFDLILQESVYSAASIDITDQVIALLNGKPDEAARLAGRVRAGAAPLRIGYVNSDRVSKGLQPTGAAVPTDQVVQRANRLIRSIFDADRYDVILQEAVFAGTRIDLTDRVLADADPSKPRARPALRDAADALKVGYVNSEKLLRNARIAKEAQAKLEREFSDWDRRTPADPQNAERKRFQEALHKRKSEELASVVDKANRVIKEVFDTQQYDLILQEVVFAAASVDITDEVVRRLDAQGGAR